MAKPDTKAPFAYEGLDRAIHEKARLGLLTSLMVHPRGLAFGDLKQLCGLTDGNLSRHLQVLQEADLVEIVKGYAGNRPQTHCRLTAAGRQRLAFTLDGLKRTPDLVILGLGGNDALRQLSADETRANMTAMMEEKWMSTRRMGPSAGRS